MTVSEAGHRLLGVRAGWDLLGFGPGRAVRVQLARGRVTQTILPALQSEGPVSFVAGPSQMIIRPWDFVPGYVVPDGEPPRQLTGALGHGGRRFPGRGRARCGCSTTPRPWRWPGWTAGGSAAPSGCPPAAGGWRARTAGAACCCPAWERSTTSGRAAPAHRRDAGRGRPDPLAEPDPLAGRELLPPAPLHGRGHRPGPGDAAAAGRAAGHVGLGLLPRRRRAGRRDGRGVPGHGRRPGQPAPAQPGHRGGPAGRASRSPSPPGGRARWRGHPTAAGCSCSPRTAAWPW